MLWKTTWAIWPFFGKIAKTMENKCRQKGRAKRAPLLLRQCFVLFKLFFTIFPKNGPGSFPHQKPRLKKSCKSCLVLSATSTTRACCTETSSLTILFCKTIGSSLPRVQYGMEKKFGKFPNNPENPQKWACAARFARGARPFLDFSRNCPVGFFIFHTIL